MFWLPIFYILDASKESILFWEILELITKLFELADMLEGLPGWILCKFTSACYF